MFKYLISYAASRVAGDAVEDIARRALWGSLAALLLLTSFILGLMIAFWIFEPQYGAVLTAAAIAGACAFVAVFALSIPAFVEWRKRRVAAAPVRAAAGPIEAAAVQTAASVKEETSAAVDYFGALQVVASAFMFGLGAARQMRGRSG